MKHRVVGTCCKNLTQIRQLYCCCNSRGKEGSLKDGFYPKLSGSWGHCFHHTSSEFSTSKVSVWKLLFLGWSPGVPRLPIIHHSALLLSSFAYPPNSTLFTMWCNMFYSCATCVQTIWVIWRIPRLKTDHQSILLIHSTFFCAKVLISQHVQQSNGLCLWQRTLCTALC